MAKKSSSSKKPLQAEEKSAVEHAKPVLKPGKIGKEIDEIFGGKKRKKPEPEKSKKKLDKAMKQTSENNLMETKKKKKRKGEKLGGLGDPPTRARKRTEDGLAIYTEEELGVNKVNAGGTSLCPFDCGCCF